MNSASSLCFFLAALTAVATYGVKQRVINLEDRLHLIHRKALSLQESTHLLQAEKSYLTAPRRIQHLANKYLGFQPMTGQQMVDDHRLEPLVGQKKNLTLAHLGQGQGAAFKWGENHIL